MPQQYVWLNNFQLPIDGAVTWRRITPFPSQFMTGSPTENDYTPTAKQRWGSLKSGLGMEKWSPQDNDRYWDADGVDASLNVQTLSPLVTTVGSFGVVPVKIIKHNGKIWAIGHNQISCLVGTSWSSKHTTFPNPTDAIAFYGTI